MKIRSNRLTIDYVYFDLPEIMPIHSFEIISEFSQLGHRLFVFSSISPRCPIFNDLLRKGVKIVHVPALPLRVFREITFLGSLAFLLLFHQFREKPDVIYVRHASPSVIAVIIGKLFHTPVVLEVNDILLKRTESESIPVIKRIWIAFFEKIAFSIADLLLPVTEGISKWVMNTHGKTSQAVHTIPNGVNIARFNAKDTRTCRLKYGLQPDSVIIGYLGSMFRWAGLEFLTAAAPRILSVEPRVLFVIGGGEEPYFSQMTAEVKAKNITEHFRFFGSIPWEDAADFINTFDISVAPVFFNSVGSGISSQKVLAYLACGKPVVGSDIPGLGDMLEANRLGRSFKMGDVESLARSILDLLHRGEGLTCFSHRCRSFVVNRFAWSRIAREIETEMFRLSANN